MSGTNLSCTEDGCRMHFGVDSKTNKMAPSSDDSDCEEDLVVLGTPLPELDETEVTKKPTTVQDLTAKDREGRRRFHGAFTGGFSAGYFNTVGSKEGFTPSAFVSSRRQKQEDGQFTRPEDFMDDEDLEEHGIAPRKFATAGTFTSEERKRKLESAAKSLTQSSALEFGGALNELVIPEYLPIGIKLLRKMGWREGQGLGPRVKKKTKKKEPKKNPSAGKKIYGCAMPPSDSDSEDSDSFIPSSMSDLTFAPCDITPISLTAKDDVKGLGYRGLDPSLALPSSHVNLFGNPVRGKKFGKGIKGHAFGVGALEEDDDGDIFALDNMSNYDLTMKEEDDDDDGGRGNFGWTAPRKHGVQKVPVSYVGKLLEGFCLSSKPLQSRKKFPMPKLPPDFKPRHWSRRRKTEDVTDDGSGGRGPNRMTAVDRGLMLGETPIMTSVFDLVGAKDKSRMESVKEAIQMTRSLNASTSEVVEGTVDVKKEKDNSLTVSAPDKVRQPSKFMSRFTEATTETMDSKGGISDARTTPLFKSALSLQPFRKDPPKQARFEQFLAGVQHKVQDPYSQVANTDRMTEWEKAKERDEFGHSAKLYRPMSAMMSARFVEGAMLDDKNQDSKTETPGEISDEVKASEMRMFGKLTREDFEWHPDKLVCKRFNVPNPYPGSDIVGLPTVKRDKFSVFNFLNYGDYRPKESHVAPPPADGDTADKVKDKPPGSSGRQEKKKATLSSIFKVLDDPDFHKPPGTTDIKSDNSLEKKRDVQPDKVEGGEDKKEEDEGSEPDVDLFRAIFKNSDSEDSEEDDKSGKEKDDDEDELMSGDDNQNDKMEDDDKTELSVMPVNTLNDVIISSTADKVPAGSLAASLESNSVNVPSTSECVPDAKPVRSWSRWGVSGKEGKSVFSVLDEINNDGDMPAGSSMAAIQDGTDESSSEYGPALPPPPTPIPTAFTQAVSDATHTGNALGAADGKKVKDKSKAHTSHKERHKHKKEKKKKSKHKSKKEKRHKKSSRKSSSSKSRKGVKTGRRSGSEADSETSSDSGDDGNDRDVSEKELLDRFLHVSRMKSNKS